MYSPRMCHTAIVLLVIVIVITGLTGSALADVQPHGGMLRYPDVSATHIVFSYGNDLWVAPREGGLASPLSSPAGREVMPRFSPDGQTIVFAGNYDGNHDLYTIPLAGGRSMARHASPRGRDTHRLDSRWPTHLSGPWPGRFQLPATLYCRSGRRITRAPASALWRQRSDQRRLELGSHIRPRCVTAARGSVTAVGGPRTSGCSI